MHFVYFFWFYFFKYTKIVKIFLLFYNTITNYLFNLFFFLTFLSFLFVYDIRTQTSFRHIFLVYKQLDCIDIWNNLIHIYILMILCLQQFSFYFQNYLINPFSQNIPSLNFKFINIFIRSSLIYISTKSDQNKNNFVLVKSLIIVFLVLSIIKFISCFVRS